MIKLDDGITEYTYQEILNMFHITALNISLRNAFEYEMGKISKYWKIRYYDTRQHSYIVTCGFLTPSELEPQINYCIAKGVPNNKIYMYAIPELTMEHITQFQKIKNSTQEKLTSIL